MDKRNYIIKAYLVDGTTGLPSLFELIRIIREFPNIVVNDLSITTMPGTAAINVAIPVTDTKEKVAKIVDRMKSSILSKARAVFFEEQITEQVLLAIFKISLAPFDESRGLFEKIGELDAIVLKVAKEYVIIQVTGSNEKVDKVYEFLREFYLTNVEYSSTIYLNGWEKESKTKIEKKPLKKRAIKHDITSISYPVEQVHIYIPQDIDYYQSEQITNAAGEFMEALGFELEAKDEPIFSSFWLKLKFVFRKHVTAEDIGEVFKKGKRALELKHVDVPTAEQTEKLSLAAQNLVNTLDKFEEGVVRCGALLVMKKNMNGISKIFILQLSQDLIKLFEEKPQLLYNLQTTYEIVTGDVGKTKFDDTGTEPALIE